MTVLLSKSTFALLFTLSSALSACATTPPCPSGAPYAGPPVTRVSLTPAPRSDPFTIDDLQSRFEALVTKTSATQAQLAILHPDGRLQTASVGNADPDAPMWWASTGKMMTATIILQLVEEDRLSLDTPIARWFPDLPHADQITIDQLLTHTSGLFSFNADKTVQRETGYKSPDRLLGTAINQGADFCPGTNWNYSNTGYLVLGLIAEEIDRKPFADIVQARIAAPLGLETIRVIQRGDLPFLPAPVGQDRFEIDDLASIGGAGAIAFSAEDGARFLQSLLNSDLLSGKTTRDMLSKTYPLYGSPMRYGRGLMVIDVPDPDAPRRWIGHSGGSPDGKGLVIRDEATGAILAVALNTQAPAEAIVNGLLRK